MDVERIVQLVERFGSFGLIAWLVIWTGPRVLREMRATRDVLERLVWRLEGRPAAEFPEHVEDHGQAARPRRPWAGR